MIPTILDQLRDELDLLDNSVAEFRDRRSEVMREQKSLAYHDSTPRTILDFLNNTLDSELLVQCSGWPKGLIH